jgi:hypothetical protein
MLNLLKSRRFAILLFDVVLGSVMLLIGTFVPEHKDLIAVFVGMWQPVFLAMITAYTVDDNNDAKLERAKIEQVTSTNNAKIYAAADAKS